jgi:hypothetical protein
VGDENKFNLLTAKTIENDDNEMLSEIGTGWKKQPFNFLIGISAVTKFWRFVIPLWCESLYCLAYKVFCFFLPFSRNSLPWKIGVISAFPSGIK